MLYNTIIWIKVSWFFSVDVGFCGLLLKWGRFCWIFFYKFFETWFESFFAKFLCWKDVKFFGAFWEIMFKRFEICKNNLLISTSKTKSLNSIECFQVWTQSKMSRKFGRNFEKFKIESPLTLLSNNSNLIYPAIFITPYQPILMSFHPQNQSKKFIKNKFTSISL